MVGAVGKRRTVTAAASPLAEARTEGQPALAAGGARTLGALLAAALLLGAAVAIALVVLRPGIPSFSPSPSTSSPCAMSRGRHARTTTSSS